MKSLNYRTLLNGTTGNMHELTRHVFSAITLSFPIYL